MTGSSVRMPTDAPLTLVVPDYEVIENSAGFGRAHARYRLVITEAGSEWQVRRRWTELRMTIDSLRSTHPAAFTKDKVPDFEPHAWWRIGSSALDPKFLSERCASMQELLQALCDVLKVSIVRQDGPSALLALLMDCDTPDAPAEALMQRAHTTGGDLRADPPTPPADWRRAQSAAGALHSPERQQQRTSASPTRPREADGPNSREAEGSGQPAWLTEADRLLQKTSASGESFLGDVRGAAGDDSAAVAPQDTSAEAAECTCSTSVATPAAKLQPAVASEVPAMASAGRSTVSTPETIDASPAHEPAHEPWAAPASSTPEKVAEGAEEEARAREREREQERERQREAIREARAAIAAQRAAETPRPPIGPPSDLMANHRRLAAEVTDYQSYEQLKDQMRSDPRMSLGRNGSGGKQPKQRQRTWPMWSIVLVLVLVVVRCGFLMYHLRPSQLKERIEQERRKTDARRPIQGPRGLMYPVEEPTPTPPLAVTPSPTVTEDSPPLLSAEAAGGAAEAPRAEQQQQQQPQPAGAKAFSSSAAAVADAEAAADAAAGVGVRSTVGVSTGSPASASPPVGERNRRKEAPKRGSVARAEKRRAAAAAERQHALAASEAAAAALMQQSAEAERANKSVQGVLAALRARTEESLSAASIEASRTTAAANEAVALTLSDAAAAEEALAKEALAFEEAKDRLVEAKAERRSAAGREARAAALLVQRRSLAAAKRSEGRLKEARKRVERGRKALRRAEKARAATAQRLDRATRGLWARGQKLIDKASRRGRKQVVTVEARVGRAIKVERRAKAKLEVAEAKLEAAERQCRMHVEAAA